MLSPLFAVLASFLIYSQTDLYSEWRPFYIDYNLLKRELKVAIPFLFHASPILLTDNLQGSYDITYLECL